MSRKSTKDEYITNYISRSLKHSRLVCNLLFFLFQNIDKLSFPVNKWELLKRAVNHDNDKFTQEYMENMADFWLFGDQMTDEERNRVNQSYIDHKRLNNHHPMYFEINNLPLSNEDVCEMACDFIASGRKNDDSIKENSAIWKNNFDENLKKSKLLEPYRDRFFEIFDMCDNYK